MARRTITATLMVAVLALFTPLIIGQAITGWQLAGVREAAATRRTLTTAQAFAAATEAAVRELVAAEEAAASALTGRPRRLELSNHLEAVRRPHPALRALVYVRSDGSALAVAPADLPSGGRPRPPRLAGRRYAITPTLSHSGAPTFWLIVPVHDRQGGQEGTIMGQVLVSAFAASIRGPSAEAGTPVLLDQAGMVALVAGQPALSAEVRDWSSVAPVAEARRRGAMVVPQLHLPAGASPYLAAFAPVGQTGWVAGVTRPRSEVLAAARAGASRGLLLTAAALVLGLVGASALGRRLARPVERLTANARALASADGAPDGPPLRAASVVEELGSLARALTMAGHEARRRALEIEAARRRFDALLGAIDAPIVLTDAEGRLVATNRGADALLGRAVSPSPTSSPRPRGPAATEPPARLAATPGRSDLQRPGPTGDEASARWMTFQPLDLVGRPLPPDLFPTARAVAAGERTVGVIQIDPADGGRRIFSTEASPVTNREGRVIGAITLFRDLTEKRDAERRQAELAAELRARTELVEALFARLPAGLALVQGADLRIRVANDRLLQLAGLTEAQLAGLTDAPLAGRRLADLFPPRVAGRIAEWIARARTTGAAVHGIDARIDGFTRESVYWTYAATPLRDSGGLGDTVLLVLTDTTDDVAVRVRAQRAAEQVEQKGVELEAVLQSLTDGVVLLDGAGRVVTLNRAAEQILGRPAEKGVRPRLDDFPRAARLYEPSGRLVPPAELPAARALGGETVERREVYVLTDRQQKRFLLLSATPLRDRRGRLIGAAAAFRDITREKEVESFKLQFIARAAHELRTPLTTIKGNLLLALKGRFGELAPQQQDALQIATRNVDAMVTLIDDLLDITRVASGRLRLFGEEVALSAILDRIVAAVATLASGKGITLTVRGAEEIVGYWDAAKIEQVFANILSNAIKFTSPGGRVEVRAFREAQLVTIAVKDSGVGIPRDKLALVFQPFVSLLRREAGVPRQRGTGLGLSIAQSIVEAHGGQMWAESEGIGRGTTIFLTLPLDHRRSERVRVNLPARVLAGETPIEPSVIADLSADGASIVAPTQVLGATRVTVEIQIPAGAALTATGEIVRVEPFEGNARFKAGVRFQALSDADKAAIVEWVRRERERRAEGRSRPLVAGGDGPGRG